MTQVQKAEDSMEDAHIVEDGVTNAQTAGTTKSSRKENNNGESANMTLETKSDKDVVLIIDVPSGS